MRIINHARITKMDSMRALIVERVFTKISEESLADTFRPHLTWVMDFKKILTNKVFLEAFSSGFANVVLTSYPKVVQIAGMESGALPLITTLSLKYPERVINSVYIRKSRKKNDLTKQIEGDFVQGTPIVLIDDVLNSGSTIKKQIEILAEEGKTVSAVFSILRYRDTAYYTDMFGSNIKILSLFELNDFTSELGVRNLEEENGEEKRSMFTKYKPEWKVTLGKANHYDVMPKSSLAGDEHMLYVGSDEGSIFAISKLNGDKVWEFKTLYTAERKGIYSSPLLYNNSVFVGAYDGNMYCLDKHTGKRKWVFLEADFIGSSPCVAEELGIVYIGLEFGLFNKKGGIAALNAETGKVIWSDKFISDFVHSSPAYSKKYNLVVCGSNNGFVYAFDAKTGERKWEFKTEGDIKYGAAYDEQRGLVFVGSFDSGLYAINVKDGTLYYRFSAHAGFFATPIVYKHLVLIGSLDRTVYAYDVEKKTVAWSSETNGRIFASPAIHEGMLYIGSNDGCVYEFEAETGKKIAQIQLTERVVNKVHVDNSVLFISTHACEVYRFERVGTDSPN